MKYTDSHRMQKWIISRKNQKAQKCTGQLKSKRHTEHRFHQLHHTFVIVYIQCFLGHSTTLEADLFTRCDHKTYTHR